MYKLMHTNELVVNAECIKLVQDFVRSLSLNLVAGEKGNSVAGTIVV